MPFGRENTLLKARSKRSHAGLRDLRSAGIGGFGGNAGSPASGQLINTRARGILAGSPASSSRQGLLAQRGDSHFGQSLAEGRLRRRGRTRLRGHDPLPRRHASNRGPKSHGPSRRKGRTFGSREHHPLREGPGELTGTPRDRSRPEDQGHMTTTTTESDHILKRISIDHPLELERRIVNRKIVQLGQPPRTYDRSHPLFPVHVQPAVAALLGKYDGTPAPWHKGLTPFQSHCVALMSQADILESGGRRRITTYRTNDSDYDSTNDSDHEAQGSQGVDTDRRFTFGIEAAQARDFLNGGGWSIKEFTNGSCQGRPRSGLADLELARGLQELPYGLVELRSALAAGRHRDPAQKVVLDCLAVFVALRKPNLESLADLLGCSVRSLSTYRKKGRTLLKEIEVLIAKTVEESNERQLGMILAAFGLSPVSEAESILEAEGEPA